MKTIEIDSDVWNKLQERATPFVDTPNTVLRGMFGLTNAEQNHRSLIPRNISLGQRAKGRTPQQVYRDPILRSLLEAGGSRAVQKVLDDVGRELEDRLNDVDKQKLNSGRDIRWRNAAQWERAVMIKGGLLKEDSPRGFWELTERGNQMARKLG